MLKISLKDEVTKAMHVEWTEFAKEHPSLAKVIDQTLLLEEATTRISDSKEFQDALENAAMAGMAAEAVQQVLRPLVKRVLANLL